MHGNYIGPSAYEHEEYLLLEENGRFLYRWAEGLLHGETDGLWHIKGQKIVLNSFKQRSSLPFKCCELIETKQHVNKDSIIIYVVDGDENEYLPFFAYSIKNNGEVIASGNADIDGSVKLVEKRTFDEIEVSHFDAKFNYRNNPDDYYFKIRMNQDDSHRIKYFSNSKWKFIKGGLKPLKNKYSRFFNRNYFVKVP